MNRSTAASVPARVAGTAAAALAGSSVVLHLLAISSMPWLLGAVMVVLAAGCLTCVPGLLRGPTVATWFVVAVMAGGMLVLHAGVMALQSDGATPAAGGGHTHPTHAHDHGSASGGSAVASHVRAHLTGQGWDLMHVGSLIAGTELVLAAGMACVARRSRRGAPTAPDRSVRQTSSTVPAR